MHIVEGYLPLEQCIFWFILSGIIVVYGIFQLKDFIRKNPEYKAALTISGLLMLALSFLNFHSVKGSCSHPTGNAFGGVVFGPAITSVIATIVLILESFFLAYGGLTTLGANIFSLGICGPFAAALVFKGFRKVNLPDIFGVIVAVIFANFVTYFVTSAQLAFAFDLNAFGAIFMIFFVTMLPLIVIDCIVTAIVWVLFNKLSSNSLP